MSVLASKYQTVETRWRPVNAKGEISRHMLDPLFFYVSWLTLLLRASQRDDTTRPSLTASHGLSA